ncbi:UNVERIFIED_CONTAM: hypothetical protein K2H54_060842 [Gekko kuhli]
MFFHQCDLKDPNKDGEPHMFGYCIAIWQVGAAAALGFVMLVTILILSVCLCRVCKRVKKRKLLEVIADNPEEAELHYAELQNLPDSSRGQCDGGVSPAAPAIQSSDYATVAELKGSNREEGCNEEEKEDSGLAEEQRENESILEQE